MGATNKQLQDKLNMANATVAELMAQNDELKLTITGHQLHLAELMKEVETLKELAHTRLHELTCKAASLKSLHSENEKLKSDYAQLEDNYNVLSKHHNDLIYKFNENLEQHKAIEAENYALKAEIERTNRHINLAENQLNREQSVEKQPLVVNHYHNCTINK